MTYVPMYEGVCVGYSIQCTRTYTYAFVYVCCFACNALHLDVYVAHFKDHEGLTTKLSDSTHVFSALLKLRLIQYDSMGIEFRNKENSRKLIIDFT